MADAQPWYAGGLRFACRRCGGCCIGQGSVRVSDAEIGRLAALRGLADHEFRAIYTRRLRGGDVSLREKKGGECIFYGRERGCTVYEERPRQCRTWPFWQAVVHSPERWAEEAASCPGMNRGPFHDARRVEALAREDGTSGAIPGEEPT